MKGLQLAATSESRRAVFRVVSFREDVFRNGDDFDLEQQQPICGARAFQCVYC